MDMVVMLFDVVIGMVAMICEVMQVKSMILKLRWYGWHADNDDMMVLMFMRGDADYDDGDAGVILFMSTLEGAHVLQRCGARAKIEVGLGGSVPLRSKGPLAVLRPR